MIIQKELYRRCKKCGAVKLIEAFRQYRNSYYENFGGSPTYRYHTCRDCEALDQKIYYKNNRVARLEYQREYRKRQKLKKYLTTDLKTIG